MRNSSVISERDYGTLRVPVDSCPKKNNILFVYPGVVGKSFFNMPKTGWNNTWHYLGFSILSAGLKIHGFSTTLIDLRNLLSWEHFEHEIEHNDAQTIFLTASTALFPRAKEIAQRIKKVRPELPIVIGGVHASIFPNDALNCEYFDHVVSGEGEWAALDIAYAYEKGVDLPRTVHAVQPVMAEVPLPDRDLFKYAEDPGFHFIERPHASIITSRGCPYKCSFCQPTTNEVFGGKVRQRPVEDVIEELIQLKEMGYKSVRLLDDLFFINPRWVKKFIAQYKEAGLDLQLIGQARSDIIVRREELFRGLREIGLEVVHIGYESGSDRVLQILKKGEDAQHHVRAFEICNELGVHIFCNYIFGTPTETAEEMQMTIDIMNENKIRYRGGNILFPTIGTDVYDDFKKEGLLEEGFVYEHSSITCIEDLNPPDAPYEKGFFKNVDYTMVKEYLDKSYILDFPDNDQFKVEIERYLDPEKHALITVTSASDSLGDQLMPTIKRIVAQQPEIQFDVLVPFFNENKIDKLANISNIIAYNPMQSGLEALKQSLSKNYSAVLIPVFGQVFYVGWTNQYEQSAALLKTIQTDQYFFLDEKLYLSEISSTNIQHTKLPDQCTALEGLNCYELDEFQNQITKHNGHAIEHDILNACRSDWLPTSELMNIGFFGAGQGFLKNTGRFAGMQFDQILGIVDNDQKKHGSELCDIPVISLADLMKKKPDLIVITSMYWKEIMQQLAKSCSQSSNLRIYVAY